MSNDEQEQERQEAPEPTGKTVYGKAHADLSTEATDEPEEGKD